MNVSEHVRLIVPVLVQIEGTKDDAKDVHRSKQIPALLLTSFRCTFADSVPASTVTARYEDG